MANPAVGIRLDENLQARLKALGEMRSRSPHYLMKEAIEKYINSEEAIEAEKQLLRERREAYELTGEAIDHDDIKAWTAGLSKNTGTN